MPMTGWPPDTHKHLSFITHGKNGRNDSTLSEVSLATVDSFHKLSYYNTFCHQQPWELITLNESPQKFLNKTWVKGAFRSSLAGISIAVICVL